jgi:hypothetical protein
MKAAGMVPLTVNDADMKALVSYVTGLGGASDVSPSASTGPSISGPAKANDPTAKTQTASSSK